MADGEGGGLSRENIEHGFQWRRTEEEEQGAMVIEGLTLHLLVGVKNELSVGLRPRFQMSGSCGFCVSAISSMAAKLKRVRQPGRRRSFFG